MKKITIFLIACFSVSYIQAQVGIKTNNPKGALHIDGKGDNPESGTISNAQIKNDLCIDSSLGSMNVGIGAIPKDDSNIQLELGGNSSAFLPNRVALTGVSDKNTVSDPVDGMIVYNTQSTGSGSEEVSPGLYTFFNDKWNAVLTKDIASVIERRDLWVSSGNYIQPTLNADAHSTPSQSTILTWANPEDGNINQSAITLPETGSYVFSFRFYMNQSANAGSNLYRGILYLWALKGDEFPSSQNSLPTGVTVEDGAEINLVAFSTKSQMTATLTLTASGNKGDKISFRIGAPKSSKICTFYPIAAPLQITPLKTSLIFWKL